MMVEVNNLRGTGRRRGWLICLRLACLRLAVLAVLAVRRRDDVHGTFFAHDTHFTKPPPRHSLAAAGLAPRRRLHSAASCLR